MFRVSPNWLGRMMMDRGQALYRCMGGSHCDHVVGACTATNEAYQKAAKALSDERRALPSEPPASHAIITKLIGYAGHEEGCHHDWYENGPHGLQRMGCTCGYSDTLAEAREFMEVGDE